MTNAARVWFILQYFGLKAVILNGGWPALASAAGLPPAAAPSRAVPGDPGVRVGRVGRPRDVAGSNSTARACVRHPHPRRIHRRGCAQPARSGHLPGARHLSHVDLMDHGVVQSAPVLRAMLEGVGFGPGDHIVTHCEGGGRAALAAAAAVRAGFDDVRVYYMSFADRARDEKPPGRPGLTSGFSTNSATAAMNGNAIR